MPKVNDEELLTALDSAIELGLQQVITSEIQEITAILIRF